MHSFFSLLGVPIVAFISTNVDDLFVLVGFFTHPRFRMREIVIGQYLGIGTLFGLSAAVSLLSLAIPRGYIGLLGFLPILIGAKQLFRQLNQDAPGKDILKPSHERGALARTVAVAAVTIGNGGDNVGVYAPLLAIRPCREIAAVSVLFAVLTGILCFMAYAIVNHPWLGGSIRHHGPRLAPFVFIAVGIFILYQSGATRLLFH